MEIQSEKKPNVIKIKVLLTKKNKPKTAAANIKSESLLFLERISKYCKPPNFNHRPVMGTTALLTKTKFCNNNIGEIVENLVFSRYRSSLTYFNNRSLARRKLTRKRKLSGASSDFEGSVDTELTEKPADDNFNSTFETSQTYDEVQFLKEALGNHLDAYSSTAEENDENKDRSVSTCDISELLSCPDNTLNNTISNMFDKSISSYLTSSSTSVKETPRGTFVSENPGSKDLLLQQLLVQEEIIQQISKVVAYCKNSKQFSDSDEYIEAERVLLLSLYKRNIILRKIQKAQVTNDLTTCTGVLGNVCLSNLSFPTKNISFNVRKGKPDYCRKFLCVLTHEENVMASRIVTESPEGVIKFKETFSIVGLRSNFEVHLTLFTITTKNSQKSYNTETNYHLSKDIVTCPSPKAIFSLSRRHKKTLKLSTNQNFETSFLPWGYFTIRLSDVNRSTDFTVNNVPVRSNLQGTARVDISAGVEMKSIQEGFIEVGTKSSQGAVCWNRLWGRLIGHYLKFWTYPSDEDFEPNIVINLENCELYDARRETCSRPRTLVLVTKETERGHSNEYLFYFENSDRLGVWRDVFDSVLKWCKK